MPEPPTRPDAYDDGLSAIREHVEDLAIRLAIWSHRSQDKPDAHARRCANDAMDAIDAAVRELHGLRASLTGEIRAFDDATAKRVDAMLRELRGEAGQ